MLKLFKYSLRNILFTSFFVLFHIAVFSLLSFLGLFDETLLYDYLNIATCAVLFFAGFIIAGWQQSVIERSSKRYLWLGSCILAGIALPYFGTFFVSHSFPQYEDLAYFVLWTVCGLFGLVVQEKLLLKYKYVAYIALFLFFALLFLPFLSLDLETYSGNRLIEAVKADDFGKVKKVVTSENVNFTDETGATPIMWAAYSGNVEILDFLAKNGADVRKDGYVTVEKDSNFIVFVSPLDAAAAKGHLKAVKYLIEEAGFEPDENPGCFNMLFVYEKDVTDFDKVLEVIEKTDHKYLKTLRELDPITNMKYSKSEKEASFLYALFQITADFDLVNEKYDKFTFRRLANNRKKIDEMFKGGIRKAESYEFFIGENGETPLITAASKGNTDIVSYLISKGADVNYKDCDGNTPLSVAREEKRPELIEMLLKNGAWSNGYQMCTE